MEERIVNLEIPVSVADVPGNYGAVAYEVPVLLGRNEVKVLDRILAGLREWGSITGGGDIEDRGDVLRWILEQCAGDLEIQSLKEGK